MSLIPPSIFQASGAGSQRSAQTSDIVHRGRANFHATSAPLPHSDDRKKRKPVLLPTEAEVKEAAAAGVGHRCPDALGRPAAVRTASAGAPMELQQEGGPVQFVGRQHPLPGVIPAPCLPGRTSIVGEVVVRGGHVGGGDVVAGAVRGGLAGTPGCNNVQLGPRGEGTRDNDVGAAELPSSRDNISGAKAAVMRHPGPSRGDGAGGAGGSSPAPKLRATVRPPLEQGNGHAASTAVHVPMAATRRQRGSSNAAGRIPPPPSDAGLIAADGGATSDSPASHDNSVCGHWLDFEGGPFPLLDIWGRELRQGHPSKGWGWAGVII